MEKKDQFTEAEWRILMFAPLWVFCGVANADAAVDENEMAALAQEVEDAEAFANPLVREVFQSLRHEEGILQSYRLDEREMDAGLAEVADILARKADPADAAALKKALIYVGQRVAQAAAETPFTGQRVSGEEQLTLFRVADILGVPLDQE